MPLGHHFLGYATELVPVGVSRHQSENKYPYQHRRHTNGPVPTTAHSTKYTPTTAHSTQHTGGPVQYTAHSTRADQFSTQHTAHSTRADQHTAHGRNIISTNHRTQHTAHGPTSSAHSTQHTAHGQASNMINMSLSGSSFQHHQDRNTSQQGHMQPTSPLSSLFSSFFKFVFPPLSIVLLYKPGRFN